jgi:hypothetical protein
MTCFCSCARLDGWVLGAAAAARARLQWQENAPPRVQTHTCQAPAPPLPGTLAGTFAAATTWRRLWRVSGRSRGGQGVQQRRSPYTCSCCALLKSSGSARLDPLRCFLGPSVRRTANCPRCPDPGSSFTYVRVGQLMGRQVLAVGQGLNCLCFGCTATALRRLVSFLAKYTIIGRAMLIRID